MARFMGTVAAAFNSGGWTYLDQTDKGKQIKLRRECRQEGSRGPLPRQGDTVEYDLRHDHKENPYAANWSPRPVIAILSAQNAVNASATAALTAK